MTTAATDKLNQYKGLYQGERCFVVGTGPSLDKVPSRHLEALGNEWTFGVNTLLMYERLPWVPSFYCVSEVTWLENVGIPQMVHGLGIKLPSPRFYCHHWPLPDMDTEGWSYVHYDADKLMDNDGEFGGFGEHLDWVAKGNSAIMFAVQLACWMGFTKVYLLGCDASRNGHAGGLELRPAEPVRQPQDGFLRSASNAREVMARHGVEFIDLTKGGLLTIPRQKIEDVL